MKGFKKDGKFIPTEKRSKSTLTTENVKFKKPISFGDDEFKKKKMGETIQKQNVKDVFTYDEAPQELKDKIIEQMRDDEYQHGDEWFAEYDGVIYDQKTQIADYDMFNNYSKKYYDLDRGQYIQFPELEVKDEIKLLKVLGLPKSILNKVEIGFNSERERNTEINFHEQSSGSNLAIGKHYDLTYEEYKEDTPKDEDPLTKKEFEALEKASEKWDDLMHDAWKGLRDNYEYQFTDEALIEKAQSNDYEFDNDGNLT
jgi:hypothetical protein